MSRITAPASKLARTIGSNASSIPRASNTFSNASKSAASVVRKPDLGDHHRPGDNHENTATRHLSTLTPSHRPQPTASRTRTIPLMQTFTTSSPRVARQDTSTIDFAVLPSPESLYNSSREPALRVPLLPDNYNPDRSAFAPEEPDTPPSIPEIAVVAADPENVSAVSPLTEVSGMDADGIELGFVHHLEDKQTKAEEGGMIRDLWKGLMDDVFGEEKKKAGSTA